jgi:3',5'-cyclic AMP phosphodiesterase CpdA
MRLLAIGDVHGCARALETLLEEVAPGPEDVVVTLGDYVNKGHDVRGVLAALRRLREATTLVPLMGNHDETFLCALAEPDDLYLRSFGHRALSSYGLDSKRYLEFPSEDRSFLADCAPSYETEAHLFVHANADPSRPLAQQEPHMLRYTRLDAAQPAHSSGKTLICGHSAQPDGRILDLGHTVGIDTYACGGQWLTCLDVNSGQLWQANEQGQRRSGHRGDRDLSKDLDSLFDS